MTSLLKYTQTCRERVANSQNFPCGQTLPGVPYRKHRTVPEPLGLGCSRAIQNRKPGGLLMSLLPGGFVAVFLVVFAALEVSPTETEDPAKPALRERVDAINQRIADDLAHLES